MKLQQGRDFQHIDDKNSLAWLLIAKTEELRVRVQETAALMNERMRLVLENEVSQNDQSVER